MNLLLIKKNSLQQSFFTLQISLLLSYFALNIINVGGMSTALPLLASFVAIGVCAIFIQLVKGALTIKYHFIVFLLFVSWLVFRVVLDTQNGEYLKQLTIGTGTGLFLFYMLGFLVSYI